VIYPAKLPVQARNAIAGIIELIKKSDCVGLQSKVKEPFSFEVESVNSTQWGVKCGEILAAVGSSSVLDGKKQKCSARLVGKKGNQVVQVLCGKPMPGLTFDFIPGPSGWLWSMVNWPG
jgi:hypothetical protein